jgi:hypothetical protein
VRDLSFIAHTLDVIDDVVGVFLERVVHARFEVRLRAVVIDAESAADVHITEARARALQFDIHASSFHHRGLDLTDVRDLAAEVEMQKLEAIFHARGLQFIEGAQRFGHGESELRSVAA